MDELMCSCGRKVSEWSFEALFGDNLVKIGHEIEGDIAQIPNEFGMMVGDVQSSLIHDLDRPRVKPVRFHARGPRIDAIPKQGAGPSFGHLAAARISGAQEQDVQFFRSCCRPGRDRPGNRSSSRTGS